MLLPFSLWGKGWGLGYVTLPEKSFQEASWGFALHPGFCILGFSILGINPQVNSQVAPQDITKLLTFGT
jgi:hypothetical protein